MTIWCELAWISGTFQPSVRISLDEQAVITHIEPNQEPQSDDRIVEGLITPGFINAHCHLELSHLYEQILMHTGMAGFVETLQQKRNIATTEQKNKSQIAAIQQLKKKGVVGVADICNSADTISTKSLFPEIQFHNFLEVFGLTDKSAQNQIDTINFLTTQFSTASVTPHAPYSVATKLLAYTQERLEKVYSVHLFESEEEMQLYEQQKGALWDLFSRWGIPIAAEFYRQNPIQHISAGMPQNAAILWVHNVWLTNQQIEALIQLFPKSYFCLCPRANLFINNRLPDFSNFLNVKTRLCLGTDSLAGTTSLDLLADAKILMESSFFEMKDILNILTLNPAKALGWENEIGNIEIGKSPGINQLFPIQVDTPRLLSETSVQPIASRCSIYPTFA